MATGDTHPARRIPVPESGNPNDVMWDLAPGDYCGPIYGYTSGKPAVFLRLPNFDGAPAHVGGIRHVTMPLHVFTEQEDGSLEIRESLGCEPLPAGGYAWHGYLDAGNIWREC